MTDKSGSVVDAPIGEARYIYESGLVTKTPLTFTADKVIAGETNDFRMELQGNEPGAVRFEEAAGRIIFNTGKEGVATGRGFEPGTDAEVWLFSKRIFLGLARVKADGTFERTFTVPVGVELGEHAIQAEGTDRQGKPRAVNAGVIVEGSIPATGANAVGPNVAIASSLAVLGSAIVVVRRRRVGRRVS
jgi:hypothetical protein